MSLKRVIAFVFDLFICIVISSLIYMIPVFQGNIEETETKLQEYTDSMFRTGSDEASQEELIEKSHEILVDEISMFIIQAGVIGVYFGVLSYFMKGQTLGKKIFKLRVVPLKGKNLSPGLYILREIIETNLIFRIVSILILIYLSSETWYKPYNIISNIMTIMWMVTIGFMIFRKDERGLQDVICKTKVVSTKVE